MKQLLQGTQTSNGLLRQRTLSTLVRGIPDVCAADRGGVAAVDGCCEWGCAAGDVGAAPIFTSEGG